MLERWRGGGILQGMGQFLKISLLLGGFQAVVLYTVCFIDY